MKANRNERDAPIRQTDSAGRRAALRTALLPGLSALVLSVSTAALGQTLPTNGSVAAGSASISSPRPGTLNINQSSNQAIINWQSFSVGAGGTVNFNQPGASSATLNRVTGSTPSSIAGTINAPGTVLLINPNGIAFTKSGVVNTGSFAASTLDIKDQDFLSGNYKFSGNGSSATVVNSGRINVSDGGFAALLGGRVANNGVITARLGKVGLASGEMITLDMSGDGFVSVAVPSNQLGNLRDGTGKALVSNKGKIIADGGTVFLSAATASTLLRDAVNVPGSIRANSVGSHNGRIVIGGGTGRVRITGKLAANGKRGGGSISVTGGDVKVAGKVEARSSNGQGGLIDLTGANVSLVGALIDASGATGGGTILIGGGPQGSGPLTHARSLSIDSATVIRADALNNGNGGVIVAWSDGQTTVAGNLSARGGPNGGDGGSIETSGHSLDFTGITVNASAVHGQPGNWLLDPTDLTVDFNAANSINGSLNGGTSVTLQTNSNGTTSGPGNQSSGAGDININSVIAWNSGATLTLNAFHSLNINAEINVQNDAGKLVLNTGFDPTFTRLALLNFDYSGWVQFSDNSNASATGRLTINGTGYTLLYGCFCIANNDNGNYALAFTPNQIPTGPSIANFNGTFEGLGNAQFQFGGTNLFASVGPNGIVRDFGLTSEPFTGNGLVNGPAFIGTNQGILANAYLTECGDCGGGNYNVAAGAGALVGTQNGGLITNSYVIGTITGGGSGLVGTLTNGATLRNSFFLGAVQGTAGGLIGTATNSFVTNVYTDSSGGLAASTTGTTFTNAYYDKTTFGNATTFGTGLTTTQFQAALPSGFSSSVWGIIPGTSYPYLLSQAANNGAPVVFSGTAYTDSGATPAVFQSVSLMIDGFNFADTISTEKNGYYYFIEPPGTVASTGSTVFTYVAQVQNINFNPVTVETSVNTALNVTHSVTGMDLWANTFGVSTSATLVSQVDTATPMSAFLTQLHDRRAPTPGCCLITTSGSFTIDQATSLGVATHNGGNLTVNAAYTGPQLNSAGNVFINASISGTGIGAAGNITVAVPINYTGPATMTAGGSITFDNTFSSGGATVLNAGGSIIFENSFSSTSTVTMTAGTSITFDSSFSSATTTTLTASTGAIAFDSGLSFTALTLNAGTTINFSGALNSTGSITLNAGGNITTEPVSVGTFILAGGTWSQIGSSLPAFSVTDFRITGGTFSRFANTSTTNIGSSGNPYQIFDVYGLQAVASTAFLNKGYYFVLTQNIDASTTAAWWSGAGFSPIGNGSASWTGAGVTVGDTGTAFTGTFNGAGYTVNSLFINRGSQTDVGLFGSNAGTIENLGVINGSITGFGNVGGLAGNNLSGGVITNSYTTMFVTGQYLVGGFVGTNLGTISQSYALSQVTGTKADIGGFVGDNRTVSGHSGLIQDSYSESTVIGTGATQFGGFFGENEGSATISNSYASSIVSGTGGGFGGVADASAILINDFWNIGPSNQNNAVQSGAANATGVSGLGDASMRVATSFTNAGWDFTSIWGVVNGASLPYLRWQIPSGVADVVTGTAYKDSGLTLLSGGIVSIQVDGVAVGSGLTGTNGIYSILIPASAIGPSGSNVLAYELKNTSAGILNSASFAFQVTGPTVAMPDIWGGYLTMADPGANISSINAAIAPAWTAAGAVSAPFASSLTAERLLFSGAFTVDQSPTMGTGSLLIATTTGNNITVTTPLALAGTAPLKLNSGKDIVFQSGATLSGSGPISLTAAHDIDFDAVSLSTSGAITATATNAIAFGAISGSGSITATTTGAGGVIAFNAVVTGTTNFTLNAGAGQITDTADFGAGQFILNGGTWNQIANPLPAFSATDFRINGGLFERFANASTTNIGSSANPYQIVDIYGLQALESGTFLSNRNLNFELINNIDASLTATWNSGSGFLPLGAGDQMFTIPAGGTYGNNAGGGPAFQGTFNGQYYTINNITINSNRTDVGVFGSNAGTINNVGVVGGSITGPLYVGGLVGFNFGTINNSFTQTTVSGGVVGGFAGGNGSGGVISQSYANSYVSAIAGAVFANAFVGLAGGSYSALPAINWSGTIKDSYVIPAGGASGFASAYSQIFCACGGMQPSAAVFTNDLVSQGGVAQYAGGLPNGFSSSIWGLIPGYSYPYLLWQFPGGTPQAVSGQAFATTSGIGLSNTQLALFVNGAAAGSTVLTDGSGYYQFLVPQGTIGASSQILVYAPTLTTTNGAASMLQTSGNVANNNLYVGYLGWTTAGTTFSGLAAAETAAFGGNASIQSYVNALPNLEITSTNSNPFTINQPLTPTGGLAIFAYGGISVTSAIITGSPLYLSALNGNDVTVTAPISSTSSVAVLAGGNITVNASISSTSSVSAQAGGDITFEVPVSAGSSFAATGGNITLQAVSWANGPLTINATGTLTLDGVLTGTGSNAGGTIRAGGPITIPAASWQNGMLTIAATGAVNLGAMNGTGSNAGVTISGTNITTSALSWANGPLTLIATGAVTFNGVLNGSGTNAGATITGTSITSNAAIGWQDGLLTMTSAGAINLNGTLNGVGPGAGASITGASVTTAAIDWEAANLTLHATNGDVNAGNLFGWGPGASLTLTGHNVTISGNASWSNGGFNLQATAGRVLVTGSLTGTGTGAGITVTGQSVEIDGSLQYANGSLNVASSGDVYIGNGVFGGGTGAGGNISGVNVTLGGLTWANGTMTTTASAALTINGNVDGMGSAWNLSGAGTIGVSGAVGVGTFNLNGGNWVQNGSNLAPFYAGAFNLAGGTQFTRFSGGDGSPGNPYQIVDIYGLQGIVTTPALFNSNFALAADIQAGTTANWNGGAGFIPIGNASQQFSGSLDGQNHDINGLTINRPGNDNVGLFGYINGFSSAVRNLNLTNVNISGNNNVGGLAGSIGAAVQRVSVTGNVTGQGNDVGGVAGSAFVGTGGNLSGFFKAGFSGNVMAGTPQFIPLGNGVFQGIIGGGTGGANVGGLVGVTTVSVSQSYAFGTVTAQGHDSANIGGLVGWLQPTSTDINQNASVTNSVSAASVNALGNGLGAIDPGGAGAYFVGGLIGQNGNMGPIGTNFSLMVGTNQRAVGGIVSSSVATGAVTGAGEPIGGLVGMNAGAINNSSATGAVTILGSGRDPNGASSGVGGLVGYNIGSINQSFATGNVSGVSFTGGLVGQLGNDFVLGHPIATITDSYETGNVFGTGVTGGLIGALQNNATFAQTYAIGAVSGGAGNTGGLIGWVIDNNGQASNLNNYWDFQTTGQASAVGAVLTGGGGGIFWSMSDFDARNPGQPIGLKLITVTLPNGSQIQAPVEVFSYDGFNFNSIWAVSPSGYPVLRSQTVLIVPNDTSAAYGSGNPGVSYTAYGELPFQSVSGVNLGITGTTITGSGGSLSNSSSVSYFYLNGSVAITPAAITVQGGALSRVYGDANPTNTSSVGLTSGQLANGDAIGLVDISNGPGAANNTHNGGADADAGFNYSYTTSNAFFTSGSTLNYTISYANGSIGVTPRPVSVQLTGSTQKTYDGTTAGAALSASNFLLVNVDPSQPDYSALSANIGGASAGTFASANAGSGINVTATGVGLSSSNAALANNYRLTSTTASGQIGTITPKPLSGTVVITGIDKVYDGTTAAGAGSIVLTGIDGLLAGASTTISSLTGTYSSANAGNQTVASLTGLASSNSNYSAGSLIVTGTGTISARSITVTANALTKVYGDPDPTLTYSVGGLGLATGDTQATAFTGAQTRVAGENVVGGPYIISQGTLLANSNYSITQYTGSQLAITARPITVTADALTKVYGDPDPTLTFVVGGSNLANGDTQATAFTGAQTRVAGENVVGGPYIISQGTLLANSNYSITQYTGSQLAITARPITVTADSQTKVYGEVDPTLTFVVGGGNLANGDTQGTAFTGAQTRVAGENVAGGPYIISQGTLLANSNYSITQYTGSQLAITARPITVTADAQTKVYGELDPTLTFVVGGGNLANGDTQATAFTGAQTRVAGENVVGGPYIISQGTLLANSNYSITQYTGSQLAITARPITVTADAQTKVYGELDPTLTFVVGGGNLANGDTQTTAFTGAQTRVAGENVVGGPYIISQGTLLANSNYSITQYTGSQLAITARPVIVSALGGVSTYGDSPADPGLSASSVPGQTASGLVNGEQVTVLTGLSNSFGITNFTNAGNHTVSVAGILTNTNYSVQSTVNGTWVVTQAPLTVTANDQSKTLGETFTFTGTEFTSVGLQNSETIGLTTLSSPGQPSLANLAGSPYTINISNATGGTFNLNNYRVTYVTGLLTVKAPPTIPSSIVGPNSPGTPGSNTGISFKSTPVTPVSFTTGSTHTTSNTTTANNSGDNDAKPAALTAGDAFMHNHGLYFPPISQYDADQYSDFKLPSFADRDSEAAVLTILARGIAQANASKYLIDSFWNGADNTWPGAGNIDLLDKASFSDGAGHQATPTNDPAFPILSGTTDLAALLQNGPVMIGGPADLQPVQWMLATGMAPDGKGIVCDDTMSGGLVELGYDSATKTVGGVIKLFDAKSNLFVPLADASNDTSALNTNALSGLQSFVPSTYYAVTVH